MHESVFILNFMLVKEENPNSHKYKIKIWIKIVNPFSTTEGYIDLIEIQIISIDKFSCLILSTQSLDIKCHYNPCA